MRWAGDVMIIVAASNEFAVIFTTPGARAPQRSEETQFSTVFFYMDRERGTTVSISEVN